MNQPTNSKIKLTKDSSQVHFVFPSSGVSKSTFFWFVLTVLWSWVFVAFLQEDAPGVFLVCVGFATLVSPVVFLYHLVGRRELTIDQEHITLAWVLLGYRRRKVRKLKDLSGVERSAMYKRNRRYVYGIRLSFDGARRMKFGSNLTTEEQEWVMAIVRTVQRNIQG